MTFLLPLALLLGFAAVLPILAHAMRKGQSELIVFPATRLVAPHPASAKKRHRVEDPLLLALRVLLLLGLTLLAASPFVQCSRLSLDRSQGGNVSAALLIDDSASMRALTSSGQSKLTEALKAAEELLETARPGDSFSIVLAGEPARVHTPPTTELGSLKDALLSITETDRATDVAGALSLGRSLLVGAVQKDRHLVLLSDVAGQDLSRLDLTDVLPPPERLTEVYENCALTNATRGTDAIVVETACTSREAMEERTLTVLGADDEALAPPVPVKDGATRIPFSERPQSRARAHTRVKLSGPKSPALDRIASDDEATVLEAASGLTVALRADRAAAGRKTGTATLIESGLEALDEKPRVRSLNLLPDSLEELKEFSALFIDDPNGLTPEVRAAVQGWVMEGGVSVLLLGPGIERTSLGSDFHPFLPTAPRWEKTDQTGVDPEVPQALGPLAQTWTDLAPRARAVFDTPENATVKAAFKDGAPLVIEIPHGRGLLLTTALPSSADRSDFALRPAFIELLDYAVREAAVRRGALAAPVGTRWKIPEGHSVIDPRGQVLPPAPDQPGEVEPHLAGRYSVTDPKGRAEAVEFRYATRDGREAVSQPEPLGAQLRSAAQSVALAKVGISREIALACLLFGLLELAFRVFLRARRPESLLRAES